MEKSWLPRKSQKGMVLTHQPVLYQFSACAGPSQVIGEYLTLREGERMMKEYARVKLKWLVRS